MKKYNLSQYLPDGSELGYGGYFVGRSKCINVLLVGRSQTGKSTIVETLLEPQQGIGGTGFSDTRDPACNSLILTDNHTKESHQLNIIDTPGLKEVRENEESRTDDELLKLASKCVENNITSLNVVCFVSRAGETHRLDTEVFQKVEKFLGEKYSEISMMVLTHCDEFDDDDLSDFEKSIRSHDLSKPCFDYCQLGIVRFGAVDFKKIKSHKESVRAGVVEDKLERIEGMRDNFLKKVISCAEKEMKSAALQQIYDESRKVQQRAVEEEVNKVRQNYEEIIRQKEEVVEKMQQDYNEKLKEQQQASQNNAKRKESCFIQ